MYHFFSLPLAGQNTQVCTEPDITPIFESVIKSDSILHSGPYRLDKNREVLLLGSGAVMSLTGLTLMNNVTPLTQQEIAQLDPNDINSFDRKSIGRYRDSNSGDALFYASFLLPLTFLANDQYHTGLESPGCYWRRSVTFTNRFEYHC